MDVGEDATVRANDRRVGGHAHIRLQAFYRLPRAVFNPKTKRSGNASRQPRARSLPDHPRTVRQRGDYLVPGRLRERRRGPSGVIAPERRPLFGRLHRLILAVLPA